MIKFIKITSAQYAALASKNSDYFYYLTDTNKFYLGTIELSDQDLSNYLTSVTNADNSITVTNNREIGVKVSSKSGNNLTLETESGKEGLYVNVPAATDYTVAITETAGGSGDAYSKRYNVQQSASSLNVNIDIPKDMVVSEGTIRTITFENSKLYDGTTDVTTIIKGTDTPTSADAGKYIRLTIANATNDKIYIAVKDLVDIYTAQASASQVQLAIDNNNEISASIVAGSITATELATDAVETAKIKDSAVETAKIKDANVTTAKLATDAVETAKIKDGNVTKAKLESSVQTSLGKADSAVQSVAEGSTNGTISVDGTDINVHGLGSAAYTASTDYATSAQGSKADTAVQSVVTGTTNGTIKVDNVAVNVYGLDSAAYAKTTDFDASGAAAAVLGASGDAATANTVYGAKAYAESILSWETYSAS